MLFGDTVYIILYRSLRSLICLTEPVKTKWKLWKCTDKSKEANTLSAGAPAAEEADSDDDSSDDDENQRNVVQYKHWVCRVVP